MIHIVYFGTPAFAVPALEQLIAAPNITVAAVVTQPDAPAGRGQKLQAPPVKDVALANSIPVFQPESLRGVKEGQEARLYAEDSATDLVTFLNDAPQIDALVVVAYGKIIPDVFLNYCPCGVVNVHPSLLPRWRGAAPLQRALEAGDIETGVCLMQLEAELDTGPVFTMERFPIGSDETLGSLHDRCATLGGALLCDTLPQIVSGECSPTPQPDAGVTYAEKWTNEDSTIRWSDSAVEIDRRVRCCLPVPGARTLIGDTNLKLYATSIHTGSVASDAAPGEIISVNEAKVIVACGSDAGREAIAIEMAQLPGKKRMAVGDILRGARGASLFVVGNRFSTGEQS